MATTERPPGKTTIAPGVLTTIIKLTALQVDGVSRLAQIPSSVNTLFSRNRDDGVDITVEEDGKVYADLHLILTDKVEIRQTSKKSPGRGFRGHFQNGWHGCGIDKCTHRGY